MRTESWAQSKASPSKENPQIPPRRSSDSSPRCSQENSVGRRFQEAIHICFNATSSLIAGGCAYGVAVYVLRRDDPRLKWSAVALMGITGMQWVEGGLWLDGPTPDGFVNRVLTVDLIPLALLAQAWGPLLGSTFELPVRQRRLPFFLLLLVGLTMVVAARVLYQPSYTQVTPQGHLNWWSPRNPPVYPPCAYGH